MRLGLAVGSAEGTIGSATGSVVGTAGSTVGTVGSVIGKECTTKRYTTKTKRLHLG